ncbi:GNAT family N-acetyltransferase [Aureimonas sp. AU40]|uniref:GNAT family N-acetyltransferase n=1 Tax=Aureimonas sp. AU40 TaxID=1637747 RepID=UPI000781E4A1|nr:GNAT family N-acetyltransferase [Aureimonas sp. AU40]
MTLRITIPDTPTQVHEQAILDVLVQHNQKMAGPSGYRPVALLLTDESGATVGGLYGKITYDWLFVELLAVPSDQRSQGHGTDLMDKAEHIARASGCIGVWLDTYEFQALGFYRKRGFEVFGTIEDHPIGQRRFFLRKQLIQDA